MHTLRDIITTGLLLSLAGCSGGASDTTDTTDAGQTSDQSAGCTANENESGTPKACPGASSDPTLVMLLPPCTLEGVPECTAARCVPTALLPASADPEDLADCDSDGSAGKCVPDPFVATQGEFILSRCTAADGAEGRCLSPCVPEVAANADLLIQDICQEGWLCSPCVDDQGADTGACTQGCDPGPTGDMTCSMGIGGD